MPCYLNKECEPRGTGSFQPGTFCEHDGKLKVSFRRQDRYDTQFAAELPVNGEHSPYTVEPLKGNTIEASRQLIALYEVTTPRSTVILSSDR